MVGVWAISYKFYSVHLAIEGKKRKTKISRTQFYKLGEKEI